MTDATPIDIDPSDETPVSEYQLSSAVPIVDLDESDEIPVSEDKLDRLVRLAHLWLERKKAVEEAENELARAKIAFRVIEEAELPEAMADAHTSLHATDTGETIEVVRELHASIPKGRESEANQWMIDNGNGDLVKSTVTLTLPRGAIDVLQRITKSLRNFNNELPAAEKFEMNQKLTIHPQTLNKFVRDAKSGERPRTDLPDDLLGIFHRTVARVSRPEASKL